MKILNNKIVSRKRISVMFLAIVLVTGTITALSSPSFMADVQAEQGYDGTYNNYENDYGKDNNSYKSKDNKIVKKVNCNNIDVNVNGLELSGLPPAISGLLSGGDVDEGERDANSYGSYVAGEQQSGYDNNKNSFKFVCINNNNNTVIGGGGEREEQPEPDLACKECFAANSTLQTAIEDFLAGLGPGNLEISILAVEDGIQEIFFVGFPTETIEQLCAQIENAVEELGVPLSDEIIEQFFTNILGEEFEAGIDTLIECLLEAGIIVDKEPSPPPPPDSISANGIGGVNECIGHPLCAKIEQQIQQQQQQQQQQIQQQGLSSISQEQMQQQQYENLKQLLEK